MFLFIPLIPVAVIFFIFHNYYYEAKFKRPKSTYMRNMKMIQGIMTIVSDAFEMQHYFLDNYFYWKSKEKTLFTLNICLIQVILLVPMMFFPIRYVVVLLLWGIVSLSSPFCVACGQAIV